MLDLNFWSDGPADRGTHLLLGSNRGSRNQRQTAGQTASEYIGDEGANCVFTLASARPNGGEIGFDAKKGLQGHLSGRRFDPGHLHCGE